jgi:hypothetical protein
MGEKFISKNHLTLAPYFFSGFRSKIGKNKKMILGKFEWGKTWNMVKSKIEISIQKYY